METVLTAVGTSLLLGGIKPAASFCQAIPWWHFCRVKYPPAKKISRVLKR